ncbi:hypothetical protein K0A97_01515 [Patescibacteria group bacterium]|nr:hypothetical protein [Patescibacteria group bacterium]
MKFKQISAVLASAMLVGLTAGGIASATSYPQPFVEGSQGNFAVVYGNAAPTDITGSDLSSANTIATHLQGLLPTGPGIGLGSEYISLGEESASDLILGTSLNIFSGVADVELPTLLQDRKIRAGGIDVEYFTTIAIGDNVIEFGNLGYEENYLVNTNLAADLIPVLHVNMANEAWTLNIDFDDSFNASNVRAGEILNIAGTEWSVKPNLEFDDTTLVLYQSALTMNVDYGETEIATIGGDSFQVTVQSVAENAASARIKINNVIETVSIGGEIEVGDQTFYINDISVWQFPEGAEVEIFAGSQKLEISDVNREVEINDEIVRGVTGHFEGGTIDQIDSLEFIFTPSDMEAERDEFDYLEIGGTIVDPVFGTIALTFDSGSQEFEDGEYFKIDASGSSTAIIKISNGAGKIYEFTAYEYKEGALRDKVLVGTTLDGLDRDNEKTTIILPERGKSKAIEIDRVNNNYGEDSSVRFRDKTDGTTFTVENGDLMLRNEYRVVFYDTLNTSGAYLDNVLTGGADFAIFLAGDTVSSSSILDTFDWFEAKNEVNVTFTAAASNASTISILEHSDGSHTPVTIAFDIGLNLDDETTVKLSSTLSGSLDKESEYGYFLTELGSYLKTENDDYRWIELWIPEETTEYNVYIGSSAESDIPTVDLPVFKDSEMSSIASTKNLIVVGGSCINTVAAQLLDLSYPSCDSAFSAETGVGADKFLIQSFERPGHSSKIALLVAGYQAENTVAAINHLKFNMGTKDLSVGKKYIGSGTTGNTAILTESTV